MVDKVASYALLDRRGRDTAVRRSRRYVLEVGRSRRGIGQTVGKNPLAVVSVLYWLSRGKARLKAEVAARTELDVGLLPVNGELLHWLEAERARGRPLVLCTAANHQIAQRVAAHYGIFDAVVSSDRTSNLSGKAKALALESRYGPRGFDYVGNELKDIHVWDRARCAIVASPTLALRRHMGKIRNLERVFVGPSKTLSRWIDAIRVHSGQKTSSSSCPPLRRTGSSSCRSS